VLSPNCANSGAVVRREAEARTSIFLIMMNLQPQNCITISFELSPFSHENPC